MCYDQFGIPSLSMPPSVSTMPPLAPRDCEDGMKFCNYDGYISNGGKNTVCFIMDTLLVTNNEKIAFSGNENIASINTKKCNT